MVSITVQCFGQVIEEVMLSDFYPKIMKIVHII